MALENKLGITNSAELAREEERISKKKAVELFESGSLDKLAPGRFASLQAIHKALFEDIYDFAGELRTVNLAKGNFRFAPLMYLEAALGNIDKMPQSTFDEIIEKYVEMKHTLALAEKPFCSGSLKEICQPIKWVSCGNSSCQRWMIGFVPAALPMIAKLKIKTVLGDSICCMIKVA